MSISRAKDKIELAHDEEIEGWAFWKMNSIDPDDLPPEAKLRSEIFTPFKEEEDKKAKTSYHTINKGYDVLPPDLTNPPEPDWILKNHIAGSGIIQLEVIVSSIYYFFAKPVVPKVLGVFDCVDQSKGYQPTAVVSEYIHDLKTNRDDPLTEDDTHIELMSAALNDELKKQTPKIFEAMATLLPTLDRPVDANASYLSQGYQWGANLFNSYRPHTGIALHDYIKNFIDKQTPLNEKTINELMDKLQDRYESTLAKIKYGPITDPEELKTQNKYQEELDALESLIDTLDDVFDAPIELNYKFDELDEIIEEKNQKRALEKGIKLKRSQDIYLAERNDDSILTETLANGEIFSAKVKDLKNFRMDKRHAEGLSYLFSLMNPDGHNQNFTKTGWYFDFDMGLLPILFPFRDPSFKDNFLRKPHDKMFIVTGHDILHFPDIRDADFYYWVAKWTPLPDQVTSGGSLIPIFPKNFFRRHDNEVFRNLKRNGAFVPNKYKNFLKFVIAEAEMTYQMGLVHLHAQTSKDAIDLKKKLEEIKALIDQHMKDTRKELVGLRHFRKHMEKFGERTFALAMKHFKDIAAEFEGQPNYKHFVESVDLDKIKNNYVELLLDCRLETIKQDFLRRLPKEKIAPLRLNMLRELKKSSPKMCGIFSDNEHVKTVIGKKIDELLKQFPKKLGNDQKQLLELFGKTQALIFYMSVLADSSKELDGPLRDKVSILNNRSRQLAERLDVMKAKVKFVHAQPAPIHNPPPVATANRGWRIW